MGLRITIGVVAFVNWNKLRPQHIRADDGTEPVTKRNAVAASIPKAAVNTAKSIDLRDAAETRAWQLTWLAIRDRHDLWYSHDAWGRNFTNRGEFLRVLERVDVHGDVTLTALKSKIIKEAQQAEGNTDASTAYVPPRFDMLYSNQLKDDMNELEFQIRAKAVENGVEVETSQRK